MGSFWNWIRRAWKKTEIEEAKREGAFRSIEDEQLSMGMTPQLGIGNAGYASPFSVVDATEGPDPAFQHARDVDEAQTQARVAQLQAELDQIPGGKQDGAPTDEQKG